MRPTQDWLLIREVDQKSLHSDTIIFVDPYGLSHSNLIGEVISAGPGRKVGMKTMPCQAKAGDRVIFDRKRRTIYDKDHFLVKDREILAVLDV